MYVEGQISGRDTLRVRYTSGSGHDEDVYDYNDNKEEKFFEEYSREYGYSDKSKGDSIKMINR